MSKQSSSSNIYCATERARKSSLTTLENYSPSNRAWESSLKHRRGNESIGSKISNVELDFQSDIINEGSQISSCSSSLDSYFDEKYCVALNPSGIDSPESMRTCSENQSDLTQCQFSKVQSASVGKVIDETIAAIEATNRELLSRAQAAEKSTRILQVQNSDLQRTLEKITRQNTGSSSPPQANIGHRSRPSLNFPRSNPIIHQHRNSLGNLGIGQRDSFDSLDAELLIPSGSRDRYSDITQSMRSFHVGTTTPRASLDSPLPLLPTTPPYIQHQNSSKSIIQKKSSIDNGKHSFFSHSGSVQSSLPPSDPGHQPLSSHPVRNISSPLPGSLRHHSVVLEGTIFIDNNRPKLVSLEEAQRRVKSTSTTPSKPSTLVFPLDNNGPFVEGNPVNIWDETASQQAGEKEIKSEKKKSRLQDLFTGRKNGSRDEKM
ncbi:hypothetical protein OnM2_044062 [Erysiphe neolycopersici]|uniref:Uncharacterized protein n=1 Tax=Erysiphe neolycopersici TaxID=212602 RepID=A0A420HUS0_9PEZI|nr:hypothetical protein OnM2_044062 [Erysiphe neolycopersici]